MADAVDGALDLLPGQHIDGLHPEALLELVPGEHIAGVAGVGEGALYILGAVLQPDDHELLGMLALDEVLDELLALHLDEAVGLDLHHQVDDLLVLHGFGLVPNGAGDGVVHGAGGAVGDGELGLGDRLVALVRVPGAEGHGGAHNDLLNVVRVELVLGHQPGGQLGVGLDKHVGRPVLDEDVVGGHPALTQLLGEPLGLLVAHVPQVGGGVVKGVLHVLDAQQGGLDHSDGVLGPVAVQVIQRVGHGDLVDVAGDDGAGGADAEGLVHLLLGQIQQLHQHRQAGPDVIADNITPSGQGDALVDLIAGHHGGEQVLAALPEHLRTDHGRGDDAGGGVAGDRAVLPVQHIAHGAGGKGGGLPADLAAVGP